MSSYDAFRKTLPYASELFGIYQPLLGWRSQLKLVRFTGAVTNALKRYLAAQMSDEALRSSELQRIASSPDGESRAPMPVHWLNTAIARHVKAEAAEILERTRRLPTPAEWTRLLSVENLQGALAALRSPAHVDEQAGLRCLADLVVDLVPSLLMDPMLRSSMDQEAGALRILAWLGENQPGLVNSLMFGRSRKKNPFLDPLEDFFKGDPIKLAVLSPIGIVHVYREYFFELDTFLGPPVGHVWISPGGTVELVEANSRRRFVERAVESQLEAVTKRETAYTEQDELADAIKEENQQDLKFGMSVSGGWNIGVAHAEANATFGFDTSQKAAQEHVHKQMRQQSEKLSSEIRRNFKTTFRTSTEVTDTSSRRYVVENKTNQLVNYELRRKMRKVAVQVQHVGTQLCWQVYVDEPGMDLGLAELVHVARKEDASGDVQPPAAPVDPPQKTTDVTVRFDYEGIPPHEPTDWEYADGRSLLGHQIKWQRTFTAPIPEAGYRLHDVSLTSVERVDPESDPASLIVSEFVIDGDDRFTVRLPQVNFEEQRALLFVLKLVWEAPALKKAADERYDEQLKEFQAKAQREEKEAYIEAVRERIKLASQIRPRPSEDLRAEERTIVFRRLIRQLMTVGGDEASDHVKAELVRALFDTDRMLYFVAPDWWRARRRYGPQVQFTRRVWDPIENTEVDAPEALTSDEVVGWGGAGEAGRANYYITDESEPARLGSSLGWLLQLDGDDRRNAFLNAPWVNAVLPIRPGRERDALRWLRLAHVEGADGLDAQYGGTEPQLRGLTIGQALEALADSVAEKNTSMQNTLATETVFENGFDPLEGGFRATGSPYEIFDQWIQVLPTDQVAALEYHAEQHL